MRETSGSHQSRAEDGGIAADGGTSCRANAESGASLLVPTHSRLRGPGGRHSPRSEPSPIAKTTAEPLTATAPRMTPRDILLTNTHWPLPSASRTNTDRTVIRVSARTNCRIAVMLSTALPNACGSPPVGGGAGVTGGRFPTLRVAVTTTKDIDTAGGQARRELAHRQSRGRLRCRQ